MNTRIRMVQLALVALVAGMSHSAVAQATSAQRFPTVAEYFQSLTSEPLGTERRGEAGFMKLGQMLGTDTASDAAASLDSLLHELDRARVPADPLTRYTAASLVYAIGLRPDGPEILRTQGQRVVRLSSDTDPAVRGVGLNLLAILGRSSPEEVVGPLESLLERADAPNTVGPAAASVLLRVAPGNEQAARSVVAFMRRPDMNTSSMIETIIGVTNGPTPPSAITAELLDQLNSPQEAVKARTIYQLSRLAPAVRNAARSRIQEIALDPNETSHTRRIAAQALDGRVSEDPNVQK